MHTTPTTGTTDTANNKGAKFLAISAALICLALALCSALWFWALILTVRPEQVISQWEKDQTTINMEMAESFIPRLERSITLNSLDANTSFLLARLYELLAKAQHKHKYSALAENAYKATIEKQPTWDYAWAKLANFYSNLEEAMNTTSQTQTSPHAQLQVTSQALSKELTQALIQAITLGPYEDKTQKLVIPLIFKYWYSLQTEPAKHEHVKNQVESIIRHALKYESTTLVILDSAKKYNRLEELDPLLKQKWHINRFNKYKKQLARKQAVLSERVSANTTESIRENND
jgi:hypothetical protein